MAMKKNHMDIEFNWTDQSSWKSYYFCFAVWKDKLAQTCCQFQGLMNLEVLKLKWHTAKDTEIDAKIMIKAEQTVVLSISVFVELSMI